MPYSTSTSSICSTFLPCRPPEQTLCCRITTSHMLLVPEIAGPINPVLMQLAASVDALNASASARNKRDKEYAQGLAANTAAMKKLARAEVRYFGMLAGM